MKKPVFATVALAFAVVVLAQEAKPVYENDFQKEELDKMPEGFIAIGSGEFAVKKDGENKFLELPGAPLDTFGLLVGPSEKDGLFVSARIFGTGQGRRFPTFGVGVNGVAGYKLQVSPAKKAVEILRSDVVKTNVPIEWQSGNWTSFKFQARKTAESKWTVEGKVWQEGQSEPKDWTVTFEDSEAPPNGRASIWGQPYSTTPIRFDDIKIIKL